MMRYKKEFNHKITLIVEPSLLILIWSVCVSGVHESPDLQGDARILLPIDKLAHGVIDLITMGKPLQLDLAKTDVARSAGLLFWRTGFPVRLPSGVVGRMQNYFNQIGQQVANIEVDQLERKSLAEIGDEMSDIMDAVFDYIGASPKGIYSDLSQVQVKGKPLNNAMVDIGLQFKAYKNDLSYYRDVAHKLLGVPVMPTVASRLLSIIKTADASTPDLLKRPLIQASGATNQAIATLSKSVGDVSRNIISYPKAMMVNKPINNAPMVPVEGG